MYDVKIYTENEKKIVVNGVEYKMHPNLLDQDRYALESDLLNIADAHNKLESVCDTDGIILCMHLLEVEFESILNQYTHDLD